MSLRTTDSFPSLSPRESVSNAIGCKSLSSSILRHLPLISDVIDTKRDIFIAFIITRTVGVIATAEHSIHSAINYV